MSSANYRTTCITGFDPYQNLARIIKNNKPITFMYCHEYDKTKLAVSYDAIYKDSKSPRFCTWFVVK
jgi:hypothetical protein